MTQRRNSIDNQEYQYKNTSGENNYYNNTTRGRACSDQPAEMPGREIMDQIAEAYRQNINPMISGVAAQMIEQALKSGMEPGTVILAIEETGMASRPSPYYLAAILKRWAESGVVVSRSRGGFDVSTTAARPWWR